MSTAAEIRSRINSINETKKVTDAMYMISSVKMRRARRELESTAPYFKALRQELGELLHYLPENNSPFFRLPSDEHPFGRAMLLITSDKGLAGSYNQTAIRACEARMREEDDLMLFIVGEYGRQYFQSRRVPVAQKFHYAAAFPTLRMAMAVCADLLDEYKRARLQQIEIVYTHYHPGRPGETKVRTLLPLKSSDFYDKSTVVNAYGKEYLPSPEAVLDGGIPSYLTGFIYSALVDSYCSEQEARMTAMRSAGRNAEEMLARLKVQYHSIRQAAITREMTEIAAGAKALRAKREAST
ncbi:MAG: ATP synthase F1 subunit gamma [Ruminococcaceae bacterium]|jgi:F-type H+-transporting ATPase subunit gamma|nr:ATP synthase F1 subunit gamma [Oscillospiraceae bacterium]